MRVAAMFWTIPLAATVGGAEPLRTHVGDAFEITLTQDSAEQSSDGISEGTSHDQDAMVERVLASRADGLELEYDLAPSTTAEERRSQWQFPVRVLRATDGHFSLLNSGELEARVNGWLKAAKWPRTVCGHWIFTWNAFRIDCDPQSVIATVRSFDLRSDVREGAPYQDALTRGPVSVDKER